MARVLLFDLDGTLLDSHRLIVTAFRHAGRVVLGRDLTDVEAVTRWGEPLPVRFAALGSERADALVDAYTAYYDAHQKRLASVFPGVREMLTALTRLERRLGVVTSKRRRSTARTLEVFGLASFFAAVVTAEDAAPKPAPDPVLEALRRLGGALPEDTLMVGDGVFDIQAARAARVPSVAALWGAEDGNALAACGPDYLVRSPDEVVALAAGPGSA